MVSSKNILFLTSLLLLTISSSSKFPCSCAGDTCKALVGYISPNATTLSAIAALFSVHKYSSILRANNLPLSTRRSFPVAADQTVRISFPCTCSRKGSGISRHRPIYTVVRDDYLIHIAADVFGNLVSYQDIAGANHLADPNYIDVGWNLSIPLPCGCDDVDGHRVVHYALVVSEGSTVKEIAAQYNTSEKTLLRLNNMRSSRKLIAGTVLDVPLGNVLK